MVQVRFRLMAGQRITKKNQGIANEIKVVKSFSEQ
jgi:hypothetical protein